MDAGAFGVLKEALIKVASPAVDLLLEPRGADPVAHTDEVGVVVQVPAQVVPGVLVQGEGQRDGLGLLAVGLDEASRVGVASTMDDETAPGALGGTRVSGSEVEFG